MCKHLYQRYGMGNSDGRKKNISKKKSLPDETNNLTGIINDLSFSGTAIHDRGIIIDVNDVFCRITGYSREELIGASGLIVIPPRHHEFVKNSITSNKNDRFITQLLRRDGTIIDIEVQRKPIKYQGKMLSLVEFHDISLIQKINEELRESENKFRLLFENMIEGVALHELVYDTDGMPKDYRIIEVNPAFEDHTGMTATQARGSLATAFYGTGEAPYLDEYANVVKSKTPFSFETYFTPQKKHFKISSFPLSATRFATVFEDITDYKTIMENLRISQERLNLALEASSDAIWDWDLTSNTLYFSPQWFTMLGYEADEYETSYDTWKSLLHPDDVSQAEEEVHKTISSRNLPYNIEFRMKTKDNQWKWILDRGKVVEYDENGTPLRFIGTHTDLTEIKRVEEEKALVERQLFQAQKMEAIGTLAGGLAHDFNNVLGAMKGSLDIMETYLGKESLNNADKIFKYLGTAQSSSQRAADIIKDLMALSRLEKERHNPVEINLALKHILQIAKNSFPKSVNLDFQFTESPIYVMGDPTQLEQVFLNLCVNASHAMTLMRPENDREGGNLNISIDILHADDDFIRNHPAARAGETYTEITVSDSGVGINDDDKKRIFEPFFTTKDKDQGTGLGLSMVYNIVTSHDGFLGVYSESGQGTSIKVYLPRFTADDSVLRPAKETRIFSGTGNILVIDDEENILSVAQEFLSQFGYTTILAPGPLEGLDIYRRDHSGIDAVILDLSMPVMSGYDVFLELRKINPHVKVLLSSGFSHDTRVGKLLKEGATGFIAKPYSRSMLSEKIKDVLK
ncbi:MAG: hypothetical protein CVV44_06060 [Spirochaetae bacterium HGW-Spirochaetae-1]|nr:MAG: hypothetical protein CVV44_06060 [Spirochaetae bacterium HGW-Spirochaetae-1]